ncbi:MAG: LarC family nickel insertion protein [Casimicrobiaceae bacterium]
MPSPASLAIHLDLLGGLAGDMFIAALVDALPALAPLVLAELAAVRPAGMVPAGFSEAATGGLRARRFGVALADRGYRAVAAPSASARAVPAQAPDHAGTSYRLLRDRITAAPLSDPTRMHALALLALLAGAEAHVHGTDVDAVHFHEVGDWDSLLDVVAAGCIAANLDGARWTASAPPLGGGVVRTAHGLLPVPAPATSFLLTGYPWRDDGIGGERVTPTGAAILRHLVPAAQCDARRDAGRLVSVGCGAGTRTLPGMPNIVRALVLERTLASGTADADGDVVAVLEFDVDDMTGEEIALAADHLRAESGAIDVSIGTRHGKKGRLVADFRVLAQANATAAIAQACFTETSTLGLRMREERRRILPRAEAAIDLNGGIVHVKIAQRPGGARTAKAAHDDVAGKRGLGQRRRTRATAVKRALKGGDK